MPDQPALTLSELPLHSKKTVTLGETKVLLVRTEDSPEGQPTLFAVEAECPHAKAPLEKGAVCDGRLVCPWHTGTFELATGKLLEPPPLRDLKRYAVRVEADTILVDPTPIERPTIAPVGEGKHLVFAGAGAATAAALAYLRDAHFTGKVTVVDPVPDEPVDRTQLTKNALAGQKPLDSLPLFAPAEKGGPDSFGALAVERKRATVVTLDRPNRSVHLDTGEVIPYDALMLATGGRPKQLKAAGSDLPHVFTIRHTQDLQRMAPQLQEGRRVALIGDSFIAFEAASALRQRGLHTTVLARSTQPFAQKFGAEISDALVNLHRSHDVVIHTGSEVTSVSPITVTLQTGAEIPADVVIIAIGVEPIVDFAPDLPRSRDGGLQVRQDLQLAPNVWCGGDIASVDGQRIEHWRLAEQHGRTAAASMLSYVLNGAEGAQTVFDGVPLFWTFHFGSRFNYAGHAETWDRIEFVGDPRSLEFLAFYVKQDLVAAVLGCKRDSAIAALMEPLRQPLPLPKALDLVNLAQNSEGSK